MSSLHPDMHDDETAANPLDLVEKLAVANDWPFHRQTDEELAAEIAGWPSVPSCSGSPGIPSPA